MKIFLAKNTRHSIFSGREKIFRKYGIIFTKNQKKAHIIISKSEKLIKKYNKKKILIWTNEPNQSFTKKYRRGKVHYMNVYNGQVYINCFMYYKNISLESLNDNIISDKRILFNKKNNISMFASKKRQHYKYSIGKIRNQVALYGYKQKKCDIYGKGWPKKVSKENSRMHKQRAHKKMDILKKNYCFNICFENTHYKNYVTEKIWEAILSYNVPIYKGSPWIYKIFPKNSFVDYNQFKNPAQLYNFLNKMTFEEYIRRLTMCVNIYKKFYNSDIVKNTTPLMVKKAVIKIKKM